MKGLSLANKSQLLFGVAIALVLGGALFVPWERARKSIEQSQVEVARQIAQTWLANGFSIQRSEGVEIPVRVLSAAQAQESTDPFVEVAWESFQDRSELEEAFDTEEREGQRWTLYARAIREAEWRQIADPTHVDFTPRANDTSINDPLRGIIIVERGSALASSQLLLNDAYIAAAGLVALAIALATSFLIQRRLVIRPVRALRATTDRVRRGDLDARSTLKTGDELEELSRALDGMLESLQATQARIESVNRNLDLKVAELAESNVGLSESSRLKGEFLANVSHELRTPLNSIIGFAELLDELARGDEHADPKRLRYIGNILRSGRMLLEMINELLDMAKIEAGRMEVTLGKIALGDLVEGLCAILQSLAQAKSIEFHRRVPPELPLLESDAGKVQQVLYNFLSNAIKFSPDGAAVTIEVEVAGDGTSVRLTVTDRGPGVPWDMQETIFEKFRQVDASHTRSHQGTGLGLAICRELSQMLGGMVGMRSTPGAGASFWLELPLAFKGPERPPLMATGA
ncbi:MAG: ATP-binding protein [Planctomycetota bacterium]|nr:ATP-binding protein [Planctomycetota bacterium]MDA1105172.1 ATP-binding protein [Planctomycetota bacterium]